MPPTAAMESLPFGSPLPPGTPMPAVPLPVSGGKGISLSPEDLRGQTVVVVFSSAEWNPSRTEQMTQFYNALAQTVAPQAPPDILQTLQHNGNTWYLRFAGGAEWEATVLADLDPRSQAAHAWGVQDQGAVFVVDSDGIIRFHHVTQGATPSIGAVMDALRACAPPISGAGPTITKATRRDFVASVLAAALALTLGTESPAVARSPIALADDGQGVTHQDVRQASLQLITLKINGQTHRLQLDARVTLLDTLREHLGLTGSKKGCDHGQCGACTVHVDGERTLSCLSLAAQVQGSDVTTIEGLARGEKLHPVQEAFIQHDGYQCGYCTPGQIMSAVALLREGGATTDAELREGMSGNLCRCAAYPHIIAAVKAARDAQAA